MLKRKIWLLVILLPVCLFGQFYRATTKSPVNIRSEPRMGNNILNTIAGGGRVVLLKKEPAEGFYKVLDLTTHLTGYVGEKFIKIEGKLEPLPPANLKPKHLSSADFVKIDIANSSGEQLNLTLNEEEYLLLPRESRTFHLFKRNISFRATMKNKFPVWGVDELIRGAVYLYRFHAQSDSLLLLREVVNTRMDTVVITTHRVDTLREISFIKDTSQVVSQEHPQDVRQAEFDLNIKGFVKTVAFYDLNGMKGTEGFNPYEIPVGSEAKGDFSGAYIGARQSRFGLEADIDSDLGPIKAYIEGDFAGEATGLAFRLRHAYGAFGFWTAGHTWTTFTDLEAIPYTIDNEGPNSGIYIRQGLVRYEKRIKNEPYIFGLSLENPTNDFISDQDTLRITRPALFDFAARFKYIMEKGHIQAAALSRFFSYRDANNEENQLFGWGLLGSGQYHINEKDQIYFQWIIGRGIARYIGGLSDRGLDAYATSDGKIELLDLSGGYFAYQHNWTNEIFSTAIWGYNSIDNIEDQPDDSFSSSLYGSLNTFYDYLANLQLGTEWTFGLRKNKDGQNGGANRFQIMIKYTF